ncbi:MAG: HesA/MoeB/ThiF family protein [Spirochaetaceae bacterium]
MERYSRHRDLLSDAAWERLCSIAVVVAGAGGLGSQVLELLVRLGPLVLSVWDPATLDAPDLNRQILYTTRDIGAKKARAACRRLKEINPDANVECHAERLAPDTFAPERLSLPFVLFDCLDSFAERKGLETIQQAAGCPIFHGGVEGWYGQAATFRPGGVSYRDAFGPEWFRLPKAGKPILPHVCAAVASAQVREYLGWLEAPGSSPLDGGLLLYDGRTLNTRILAVSPGSPKKERG